MLKKLVFFTTLFHSIVCFAGSTAMEHSKIIIDHAPHIALEEKSIQSFRVDGNINLDALSMRFIVASKAPDQNTLILLDQRDGTPILIAMDDRVLMYDPLKEELLFGDVQASFQLILQPNENDPSEAGNLQLSMLFKPAEKTKGSAPITPTMIDLNSIMAELKLPLLIKEKDDQLTFSGNTTHGSTVFGTLNTEDKTTIESLHLLSRGETRPGISINAIRINQPLEEDLYTFPSVALKKIPLKCRKLKDTSTINSILNTASFVHCLIARMAIEGQPELRAKLEAKDAINWDALQQSDKTTAEELKKILPKLHP